MRWVAENMRPFGIVKDRGFQSLMKTGRPRYYIPSPDTVSRDVKKVFVMCRQRIAKMLQVSKLSTLNGIDVRLLCRSMTELSVFRLTLGLRRTTKPMLLSRLPSKSMVSNIPCCSMSWRWRNLTRGLILLLRLRRYLMTLEYQRRSVVHSTKCE